MDYSYKVLRIGQLMTDQFRYPNEKRVTICTSTLIQGNGFNLLIDPGWHDNEIIQALKEQNLSPEDIDLIYLTHLHPDHMRSCRIFKSCPWKAPRQEIENWKVKMAEEDRDILDRVQPIDSGQLVEGITIIDTPGHTLGHTSLTFESEGETVVVAADAVLTVDYGNHLEVHPNTEDKEAAVDSIKLVKSIADIIIPGHDKEFSNKR